MIFFDVFRTRHNWKEDASFKLVRPSGTNDYLFLHFKTPVVFTLFDETLKVLPGSCILLSPGTPHGFYPESNELVHDWVHFMPSDEKEFLDFGIEVNCFFNPIDTGFITSALKKCEFELIYGNELYKEFMSAELMRMFVKLKRQFCGNPSGRHIEKFKELRFDLFQNPNNYLNTTCMAEKVDLSRSRFSVVYKELFGISPQNDLINARVSKASYLLSLGTLSLEKISEMCGYQNIYHFIRQFRTATGSTPGAYRKNF